MNGGYAFVLASALVVGCAEIVGIGDLPTGSDAGDARPDAPLIDAPACTNASVVLVASTPIENVMTSSGFVLAQESGTGVARCAAGGACIDPPNLLAFDVNSTFQSSAVGSSIVYTVQAATGGSIHRAALDGTADQTLFASASAAPSAVAMSGSRELWVDDISGDVDCIGCAASSTPWMQGLSQTLAVIADANMVYALALDTTQTAYGVWSCSTATACGTSSTAAIQGLSAQMSASRMASDGARLYVATPGQNYVVAVDPNLTQYTVVSAGAQAIAVDAAAGELFFAGVDGTVGRVKTDLSKTVTPLTSCAVGAEIDAIAFDSTNVYVAVPTDGGSVVYAIPRK